MHNYEKKFSGKKVMFFIHNLCIFYLCAFFCIIYASFLYYSCISFSYSLKQDPRPWLRLTDNPRISLKAISPTLTHIHPVLRYLKKKKENPPFCFPVYFIHKSLIMLKNFKHTHFITTCLVQWGNSLFFFSMGLL